jgi:outer membrane receptor protein involved in Fe transport
MKSRKIILLRAGMGAFILLAASVRAQTAAPAGAKSVAAESEDLIQLEAMEVSTGRVTPFSSASIDLPRTVNDAQPYYVFDSRYLDRSGATSLENFIKERLPMSASASSQDQSIFIGGTGSSINLRGFGAAQTLVLINGRQAPASNLQLNGGGPQPDINGIPLSAVDRVEVLPSSASGIYGGGAVGGVVNIILKRTYAGGELKVTYQNTFDTDAPIRRYDISYGFPLERGRTQVMLAASWADRKLLLYQDRLDPLDRYQRGYYYNDLANPSPGVFLGSTPNIRSSSGANLTLKAAYGGAALGSPITFVPFGTTASTPAATLAAGLLANAGRFNDERPDTVQQSGGLRSTIGTAPRLKSVMAKVRREFTPNLEGFAEFTHSGTFNSRNFTSNYTGITTFSIAATIPSNPFNQAISVALPIAGDFPVKSNNLSRRATAGVIARLPHNWKAEADYTWTRSDNSYRSTGFLASADVTAALTAGTFNPFVDTKLHPINMEYYNSSIRYSGSGTKNLVALRATGPVWRLPGGEPQLTVGADRRRDGLTGGYHVTDFPNFPVRNIVRYAVGKEQVTWAGYAEARLPLVSPAQNLPFARMIELQLTGRAEDFDVHALSSFVQLVPATTPPPKILSNRARYRSTNPTVALRWQPVQGVMLRTSFSRGFAPPTYDQLLENPDQSTTTSVITDPRRGNTTYGVYTLSGGNSDLVPERSRSRSAGVVFTPAGLKGFRFSADWSRITKINNIGTLTLQQMVESEAVFPGRVTRGPAVTGEPYSVGPVTLVDLSALNLLRAEAESIDFSAGYRRPTSQWGTFDFSALATVAEHYRRQTTYGQPEIDSVNFTTSGPLRRQGHATATWDYGRWTFGWTVRYIGSYRISSPPVTTSTLFMNRQGGVFVRSQDFHEALVAYRFPRVAADTARGWQRYLRGLELNVGVRNVFDTRPRYDVTSSTTYYYSTWGDIRLREYRLMLKKPL